MNWEYRDVRQRDIVPPERLAECQATVVGVGAIGRQVALQLAAIGVPWLQLIDHDVVEIANLAPQGFLESDLGRRKVEATADLCSKINRSLDLRTVNGRYRRSMAIGNCLFCCVDSISTRRFIWESVKERIQFFADGRMYGEVIRILAIAPQLDQEHYSASLFRSDEAYAGPCSSQSTIFAANVAAGLMLEQLAKWLRRLSVDADVLVNLLAGEWSHINN